MAAKKKSNNGVVRSGGTRINVFNSGVEVWLYDDANLKTIKKGGAATAPSDLLTDAQAFARFFKEVEQG